MTKFGVESLSDHVKMLELDFYADTLESAPLVRDYIEQTSSDENIRAQLRAQLDALLLLADTAHEATPGLYLQALYWKAFADERGAVISSSFFANDDRSKVLANMFDSDVDTPIVSAVLDADNTYIEDTQQEPMHELGSERYDRQGVFLVGTEMRRGRYFGSVSKDGSGKVTTIGKGVGWGSPLHGSCVQPREIGTSFAAPFIGAALQVARTYWRSLGMTVDSREARTRLLLSARIVPLYVGRYGSGGIPQLERLLRPDGPTLVEPEGRLATAPLDLSHSWLRVIDIGTHSPRTLLFERLKGRSGLKAEGFVQGLQLVGSQAFVFQEQYHRWESVTLDELEIGVRQPNGVVTPLRLTDFLKCCQALLLY